MENVRVSTLSEKVQKNEHSTADLEQALNVAGLGWYNIKYCLVLALFLIGGIVEVLGYAYVLPTAQCDLNISVKQRGFIASLPYIAIVITSYPWGYLVDTRGRKNMLIISSVLGGFFGMLASFMPDLISYTAIKTLGSLCIACPAAVPYTYIGEILPKKYRDISLSVTNAMQLLGAALAPLLGWAILPADFRANFGLYDFRPWRLLNIVYSSILVISAVLISFGPESPKYLVSQGKTEEALRVLQTMYAANKGKSVEDFPIKKLFTPEDNQAVKLSFLSSLREQTVPLVKPPYLKWMCLNGFLLFGIFATLNGLTMWVPDILNRVLGGNSPSGLTACQVIGLRLSQNSTATECIDTIEESTFLINSVANVACSLVALAASLTLKFIGKKTLIICDFAIIGIFAILINFITNQMVFAVLLSALQLGAVAIGPINAFAVQIFPTSLRGMAVGLSLMVGRTGSIVGTNVAGVMINSNCEATFYMFGALLLLCGLLTLLLPKSKV